MRATRDYVVKMPKDATVVAACEDVRCESWQFGWETHVDEATPLGQLQGAYIRQQASPGTFIELRTAGLTVFRFAPRQRCFAEHRTKPARFLVRAGAIRDAQQSRRLDRGRRRARDQHRRPAKEGYAK